MKDTMSDEDDVFEHPDDFLVDAEILPPPSMGYEDTDEYLAVLDQPAKLMIGELWGPKDRRNTQDGQWKTVELSWRDWIIGQEGDANNPTWGFSRHPVGKHKEGSSVVLGTGVDGARKAKAMQTMYAIGLDIDSGASLDQVIGALKNQGLFALLYTSFNNGKQGLTLKRDEVLRKLKITSDPDIHQVRQYLREHDKNRYEESFIAKIEIAKQKHQEKTGVKIILNTPPLEKFRLIFPLAEPVKLIDLAQTHQEALDVWENKVTGLAVELLGVHFDTSCTDPSRLFYTARHPKGSEDWDAIIHRGSPLRFEDVPEYKKSLYTSKREKLNAFELAGGGDMDGDRTSTAVTPSGRSLNDWHFGQGGAKDRFLIANLLEDICPDRIRVAGGEAEGHVHIECPFEHEHSSEGGTATMAVNCIDSPNEYWTWFCQHDACQGRHKLQFLEEALRAGWLDEAELFNEDSLYLLPPEDAADAVQDNDDDFEPADAWLPQRYKIKNKAIYLKDEDGDLPICAAFDVVGRSSSADGTEGAGRILSFVNENGKQVEVTIARADIVADGNAVLRSLADRGLLVYGRGKKANDRLLDLLNEITPKRQVPTVNVPGWVRDDHGDIVGFMYPTGVYDRVSGANVRLLEGSRIEVVRPKGTLSAWKVAASATLEYEDSNFYWPLGLISGFAGPILGILEWHPCGFSLSGLTSKGKTMAQIMGASVWGSPEPGRGVLFTANTTGNAMEDLAVRGTDGFTALDEIGALTDKKALDSILFALSTGRTKSRKSGPGRGLTEGDNFRPFVLLSSEQGMKNEIAGAGGKFRGGLAVRFPDVDVSSGKDVSPEEVSELEAFKLNYGHAGPSFIRYLIDSRVAFDRAKLEKEVLEIAAGLAAGKGAAATRAARVFAVAQRAGELAADAAFLGDVERAKSKVRTAVRRAWSAFTASDEAGAATGGDALLDALRSFLFGELNRRIIMMGELTEVSDGHLHARGDVLGWADSDVIYLDSSKVQDPAVLGVDIGKRDELLRQLKEMGVLIAPDGKGNTFRQLPKELAEGAGEEGAMVRNIRLCRKALGI
ncbi:DUF927 domain-containing protein [Ruegeria arenilitoris]|uniref:DUF927 domain-containing protein n=1 Tax=Ruegeria arenilitoris TaxID=1173585 RepID=UPI00147FA800|nr:DUF927 domain-containing protein [Ruegeria arenilitoris]